MNDFFSAQKEEERRARELDNLAHKEDHLLIKELYHLKHFLTLIMSLSNRNKWSAKETYEEISLRFRGGFFVGGIETDEKQRRTIDQCINNTFRQISSYWQGLPSEQSRVAFRNLNIEFLLAEQANFETALKKLCAHNGQIEQLIETIRTDPQNVAAIVSKINILTTQAISYCATFNETLRKLIAVCEELQELPGTALQRFNGNETHIKIIGNADGYLKYRLFYTDENTHEVPIGHITVRQLSPEDLRNDNDRVEFQTFVDALRVKSAYTADVSLFEIHCDDLFERPEESHFRGIGLGKRFYCLAAKDVAERFRGVLVSGGRSTLSFGGERSPLADRLWASETWPSQYLKMSNFLAYLPIF